MLSRFFSVQRILINLVFDLTASQVAFQHAEGVLIVTSRAPLTVICIKLAVAVLAATVKLPLQPIIRKSAASLAPSGSTNTDIPSTSDAAHALTRESAEVNDTGGGTADKKLQGP